MQQYMSENAMHAFIFAIELLNRFI